MESEHDRQEAGWWARTAGAVSSTTKAVGSMTKTVGFADIKRLARKDKTARKLLRDLCKKGMRKADGGRSLAEAEKLYNTAVPACQKQSIASAGKFVKENSVSHIEPRSHFAAADKRASGHAENVVFEPAAANQARGASRMTWGEQQYIALANNLPAIKRAGVVGAMVGGGLSAAAHGYAVYQGEEKAAEAAVGVAKDAAVGATQGMLMAALHVVCPPAAIAVDVGLGAYTLYSVGRAGWEYWSSPAQAQEEEEELLALLDGTEAEDELEDDSAALQLQEERTSTLSASSGDLPVPGLGPASFQQAQDTELSPTITPACAAA